MSAWEVAWRRALGAAYSGEFHHLRAISAEAGGPVPFQDFHLAATSEEAAAVLFDRWQDGFAVVLVTNGIVNFDADEDVGGHVGNSSEESWRKLNAEARSAKRKKVKSGKKEQRKSKTRV